MEPSSSPVVYVGSGSVDLLVILAPRRGAPQAVRGHLSQDCFDLEIARSDVPMPIRFMNVLSIAQMR